MTRNSERRRRGGALIKVGAVVLSAALTGAAAVIVFNALAGGPPALRLAAAAPESVLAVAAVHEPGELLSRSVKALMDDRRDDKEFVKQWEAAIEGAKETLGFDPTDGKA